MRLFTYFKIVLVFVTNGAANCWTCRTLVHCFFLSQSRGTTCHRKVEEIMWCQVDGESTHFQNKDLWVKKKVALRPPWMPWVPLLPHLQSVALSEPVPRLISVALKVHDELWKVGTSINSFYITNVFCILK